MGAYKRRGNQIAIGIVGKKNIKKIWDHNKEGQIWVRRTNEEMQELYQNLYLVKVVKNGAMDGSRIINEKDKDNKEGYFVRLFLRFI